MPVAPRAPGPADGPGTVAHRLPQPPLETHPSDSGSRFPRSPGRIDIFPYRNIILHVARAATTADAFNAVAEPRRRAILDVLVGGERSVNALVELLGFAQPQVSKHLRVLREVGAVEVRDVGRQRLYRLNGQALKPIHDWVSNYERMWSDRFDELDVVLEDLKAKEQGDDVDE